MILPHDAEGGNPDPAASGAGSARESVIIGPVRIAVAMPDPDALVPVSVAVDDALAAILRRVQAAGGPL